VSIAVNNSWNGANKKAGQSILEKLTHKTHSANLEFDSHAIFLKIEEEIISSWNQSWGHSLTTDCHKATLKEGFQRDGKWHVRILDPH
jgi:hypothetical protein